jgi:hypothetical protein
MLCCDMQGIQTALHLAVLFSMFFGLNLNNFSNRLHVVGKRLIGCKFYGNLGPYLVSITISFLCPYKVSENVKSEDSG